MVSLNKKSGFTIVELLVVIVVIGILAAITIVAYTGISQKVAIASIQSDLTNSAKKLKLYYVDNSSYPTSMDETPSGSKIYCPTPADTRYCIKISSSNNKYYYGGNGTAFQLIVESSTNPNLKYQITSTTAPAIAAASTFVKVYGGATDDYGQSIVQTSDGGYAITGSITSFSAGGQDLFIAKYTADGTLSWSKTLGGSARDVGIYIVQTSDGGYAIAGYTDNYGAGSTDMLIVKYTSNGTLSWSKTWGGTAADKAYSIVQTSDGGYAVTGYTDSFGAGARDLPILKYASDGTLSWSKLWGGSGSEYAQSIIQTSDGGYAVTGYTDSFGAGGADLLIAKYASDGTLSWSKLWGGSGSEFGGTIIQTSDGGYAVSGYNGSFGAVGVDSLIAKYASDGTLSWSKTWGGSGSDLGNSIVQTSDGGYAIGGWNTSFGAGGGDMQIIKYTSDGTLSWSKTWGGSGNDYGYSIVQTSDGGYAVTGVATGFGTGGQDLFIAKYASDGTIANCSSPMCQSPSPTVTIPSPTVTSPSPTVTSPSPTVTSPSPTVTSPSLTTTVIVP